MAAIVLLATACCAPLQASAAASQLVGRTVDEDGAPVPGVTLRLASPALREPLHATSDEGGRFFFSAVIPGDYELRAEKHGYYVFVLRSLAVNQESAMLEVVLNHLQEFEETVSVTHSPPAIDRQETAAQTTITTKEIVDLPYPSTHDFRNALVLNPGVIQDAGGRVHVAGGAENQAQYSLDGFVFSTPVSGTLENRLSADSIRSIRIETSRISTEHGRGPAGNVAIETGRGDDRFRAWASNFLPSFEVYHGPELSHWTPRFTVSGPIVRGRAWFLNATDLQYNMNIVDPLPEGYNRSTNWHGSNLTTFQVNLTPRNILTSSVLANFQDSDRVGLSPLDPAETTRDRRERFLFASVKDQADFAGWILEAGAAVNRWTWQETPKGTEPYRIQPWGRAGNYFASQDSRTDRFQVIASASSPTWRWHGRHSVRFGTDVISVRLRLQAARRPIEVYRQSGTLSRLVQFEGDPSVATNSTEFSFFGEEHWALGERVSVETGIRFDRDSILEKSTVSPRIAASWAPRLLKEGKISAGVGIYRESPDLELLVRGLGQARTDVFFAKDGTSVLWGPVTSRFYSGTAGLQAPTYVNWSLSWEQRLPGSFYLRNNWVRRTGRHVWAYDLSVEQPPGSASTANYELSSGRSDTYSYLEWTVTRTFRQKYSWLGSYAWSRTRASSVVDSSIDNPVFGEPSAGPLPWDTPGRAISWGTMPVPRFPKLMLAYFVEWHSGFPWSAVDDVQKLVGAPNSYRFPDYFNLNIHVERRFRIRSTEWALRAGFNNITGNRNAVSVVDNFTSPEFGSFSGGQGRSFTGRIRFLARN